MSDEVGLSFIAYKHIRTTRHGETCQTDGRPFIVAVHADKKKAFLFQARCKLWSCPVCAEINRQLWIATALYGASKLLETEDHVSFLTITSHRKLAAGGSEAVFGKAWDNLRRRASRASGGGEYLLIPERHADGRVHAHAIETFNLGRHFWKDNAAACGLGYIADEAPARAAAAAAAYAAKYIGKQLGDKTWPKGWRHVRTSQGWPELPDEIRSLKWQYHVMETLTGARKRLDGLATCGYMVRDFV